MKKDKKKKTDKSPQVKNLIKLKKQTTKDLKEIPSPSRSPTRSPTISPDRSFEDSKDVESVVV